VEDKKQSGTKKGSKKKKEKDARSGKGDVEVIQEYNRTKKAREFGLKIKNLLPRRGDREILFANAKKGEKKRADHCPHFKGHTEATTQQRK